MAKGQVVLRALAHSTGLLFLAVACMVERDHPTAAIRRHSAMVRAQAQVLLHIIINIRIMVFMEDLRPLARLGLRAVCAGSALVGCQQMAAPLSSVSVSLVLAGHDLAPYTRLRVGHRHCMMCRMLGMTV